MMPDPVFQASGRSVTIDGSHMKNLRIQFGLTQEELAKVTGYSDRLVRKLERGGPISRKTLSDFVEFYDEMLRRESRMGTSSATATNPIQPDGSSISSYVDSPIDSSVPESIARIWFERAFNQRDLNVIDEIFHSGVTFLAEGRVLRGRDEIRKRLSRVLDAFRPLRITIEKMITQDDTVVAYWQVEKTHSGRFFGIEPTGRTVTIKGSSMATIRSKLIIEVRDHWDVDDLMRKLTK